MTAFEPIPMGDALWGSVASPDGRYLRGHGRRRRKRGSRMRLVDLQSWLPVTTWPESGDFMFHIDQHGSVFYVTYGATAEFRFATTDSTGSTLIASLPAHYVGVGG